MTQNKIILGITGGTGCGKSAFSDAVRALGITVIDADKVGHSVTAKGEPALSEILERFGAGVMNDDGTLNRRALGEIVFADRAELDALNSITHKYIKEKIANAVDKDRGEITAIDGALLIECGIPCDYMVSVLAPLKTRLERVIKRDGISREAAQNRINSQQSDDFYKSHSHFVVCNDGTKEELFEKAKEITARCRKER